MKKKYKGYCMKFSNEELKNYMIDYLTNNFFEKIKFRYLSEDGSEIEVNSAEQIVTIVFDGYDENIFINFYGIHTSIFVHNIEIMFIDEASKGIYTSSDVYDNVVYEGNLREMYHDEMLHMFSDIILCFIDAENITISRFDYPKEKKKIHKYYDPYEYVVKVANNHTINRTSVYDNITIKY